MKWFDKINCYVLGWIEFALGTLGSIYLADVFGMETKVMGVYYQYTTTERNWGLTFLIFLGCFFSVVLVTTVFFALGRILEKLDDVDEQLTIVRTGLERDFKSTLSRLEKTEQQVQSNNSREVDDLPEI